MKYYINIHQLPPFCYHRKRDGTWMHVMVRKDLDSEVFNGLDFFVEGIDLTHLKELLGRFFRECNYTILHYENTINYLQTDIGYYLLKYHGIWFEDDMIWYALFSTPYSNYNFGQNLTNLKYKKQYDYGYITI